MKRLHEAFYDNKLVPFIGAGMSIPFGGPDWQELILTIARQETKEDADSVLLKEYLENRRYLDAVSLIKSNMPVSDPEDCIRRIVCKMFQDYQLTLIKEGFDRDNNFLDLLGIGFSHYFTFNYDHFFEKVADEYGVPLHSMDLITEAPDTQFLNGEGRRDPYLWHLHGDILHEKSIVLSRESYEKQYQDISYEKKLGFLMNHFVFLFIGVSFEDEFVRQFFEKNKNIFIKNRHYILFENGKEIEETELKLRYGLKIIRYDAQDGHVKGIRLKLRELFPNQFKKEEVKEEPGSEIRTVINVNAKNAPLIQGDNNKQTFHFS